MKKYKNFILYLLILLFYVLILILVCLILLRLNFFSNNNTRRHPEPRIPPDSRSVQILYRISGMLNESNHSHIGDGTSHALLHWHKWES